MKSLPADNKQAGYPIHNNVFVHSRRWGADNNFAYQYCRCMMNLPAGNKQADYSINNIVSVLVGQKAQDMCMNRCKVQGIVLCLGHLLLMKTRKKLEAKEKKEENRSPYEYC